MFSKKKKEKQTKTNRYAFLNPLQFKRKKSNIKK